MWIVSGGYTIYTMYYILVVYTLDFSLLLWVFLPIGYQYNIRFQNLIYVLILILCIDVEEHTSWVWPEALPILKIQVCAKVWYGNWGNTRYILTSSQYEYEVLYWCCEGMLFLECTHWGVWIGNIIYFSLHGAHRREHVYLWRIILYSYSLNIC